MNMCSDRRTGPTTSDYSCLNTNPPRARDPHTPEFLGLATATSEAMEPW